jgi:hypothetical protein
LIDQNGVGRSCICDASDPTDPKSTCSDDPTALKCQFETSTGQIVEFEPGEMIVGDDLLVLEQNRCTSSGIDMPCRCNPNFENGLECPYCSFATLETSRQQDTATSTSISPVLCLEEGQTSQFTDLVTRQGLECECQLGKTPSFPPNPICTEIDITTGNEEDCTYTLPTTGQTVTLEHLEIDLNVPMDDGTDGVYERCQCLDGLLDCEEEDDEMGPPNPSPTTPRPNPMPTPTTPVNEPTLAPIITINSGGSTGTDALTTKTIAVAAALAGVMAIMMI